MRRANKKSTYISLLTLTFPDSKKCGRQVIPKLVESLEVSGMAMFTVACPKPIYEISTGSKANMLHVWGTETHSTETHRPSFSATQDHSRLTSLGCLHTNLVILLLQEAKTKVQDIQSWQTNNPNLQKRCRGSQEPGV